MVGTGDIIAIIVRIVTGGTFIIVPTPIPIMEAMLMRQPRITTAADLALVFDLADMAGDGDTITAIGDKEKPAELRAFLTLAV